MVIVLVMVYRLKNLLLCFLGVRWMSMDWLDDMLVVVVIVKVLVNVK